MRARSLVAGHVAVFTVLASLAFAPVLAQQKPPDQVVNLADVRRQAKACDEYAQALDAAAAALRDGSLGATAGEEIRRHKAVVDPICLAQDAPSAGRNLPTITTRTADIRSLLP